MRLIDFKDLRAVKGVPYSRVQIYRLIKRGKFPHTVSLGPNRVAFLESEIDAWINERIASRDEEDQDADAA